jgi:hypothetical protein
MNQSVRLSEPFILHQQRNYHQAKSLAWTFLKPGTQHEGLHVAPTRTISKDDSGLDEYLIANEMQLYRYRRQPSCRLYFHDKGTSQYTPNSFYQYLDPVRTNLDGCLFVAIGPVKNSTQLGRKPCVDRMESYQEIPPLEIMYEPSAIGTRARQFSISGGCDQTRQAPELQIQADIEQGCNIADTLHVWLPTTTIGMSTNGADVIKFSDCGGFVAVAVSSTLPSFSTGKLVYQLLIHRVSNGNRIMMITSSHHDVISDISWHEGDNGSYLLVSSSLDGTIQIHSFSSADFRSDNLAVSRLEYYMKINAQRLNKCVLVRGVGHL